MNCPSCQYENPDDSRFCGKCGSNLALETACSGCGHTNPAGHTFCNGCGTPLGEIATQTERDPRVYTPKHLADKILRSKSALEGERKQVTVLFADVQGSTALAEQLDAEDWHEILDRFFQILTEGVHRFEGTVNQYTGDGIMALFGAPIAHEDHAQRACYTALHLRNSLHRNADEVRRAHGLTFSARMGLNSGEVVVGRIGDDLRMDYTAQGSVVHLAQRMEQLAEPGRVYLTEHTADRVPGYFTLRDLGPTPVKGSREPIRIYELKGTGEHQSRFDVSRSRGLAKFVGRGREMAQLEAAYERARAGHLQLVGVVAEAGTGKSRLLHEFGELCRSRPLHLFMGSCPPHGTATPLAFHMSVIRSFFGVLEQDGAETARAKVSAQMSEWGLDADLPFLFEFLGIGLPGAPDLGHDSESRQREFLQFIGRMEERRDGVEVGLLEDLHWLDPASEAVYLEINRLVIDKPILHVLSFRPEYRPLQADWPNYEEIRLRPLTTENTAVLLASLLGPDATDRGVEPLVQARAAGNPFFVEEIVQSLAESGCLEGARGAYRVAGEVNAIDVPDSVQAVLAARIDRLAEQAKAVLRVAAVIGIEFPCPVLEAASGIGANELDAVLHALVQAEFVFQTSAYPEVEYAFKHPLTQQVAYETQLRDPRRRTHRDVARLLEERHADRLGEKAALIARHWEEAGEALDAIRWHRRAAEWVERTDLVAAARHWRSVRVLRRAVPDDREAAAHGLAACRRLLHNMSFRVAVDLEEARALLEEGRALADAVADRRESLYLSMIHSRVLGGDGDMEANLKLAIENRRAALELDDIAARANAATFLVDALNVSGQLRKMIALAGEELTHIPRELPREEWLWGFNHYTLVRIIRAFGLTWAGRLGEALSELGQVLHLAEEDHTPEMAGYAHFYTAEAHFQAGDAERTLASAREVEKISDERPEHLGLVAHSQFAFGFAHLAAGRASDAAEAFHAALDHHRRVDKAYAGKAASYLAISLLQVGDPSAAADAAEDAITLCRRSLRAVYEAAAHGVRARALLRRDGTSARDAVEAALADAAALIERTGARTLAPALCAWRAELAAVLGDDAARVDLLENARRGYEEIGATGHAARLAKELGL